MRIAMIGTRGVPARYGGFETCVEEVGERLVRAGHDVVVFCRPTPGVPTGPALQEYRGMALVQLPAIRRRTLETLSHSAVSVLSRSLRGVDAAIVFNSANAPLLPVLRARGVPVATHVDGLEWRRDKWGSFARHYYRWAEALAVRWSDALIADASGIADYYDREFGAGTWPIAYGAPITAKNDLDRLGDVDLLPGKYHLVVARFEPENHVLEIVQGYARSRAELPLVVVGSAPYAEEYTRRVHAAADLRTRFVGAVWDQELLDQLYAGALTYLHGHSVGGTNPSLLRAAGAGAHTIAWDVEFNREVLGGRGAVFSSPGELARLVEQAEAKPSLPYDDGLALQREIVRYNWDDVAARYAELCTELARRGPRPRAARPNGQRLTGSDLQARRRITTPR